ncbi:MAG: SulP family inorganic anion transporter [Planctomycetes bacterium]|nr:SulP family inorganic anion transporter [Planctomycetota bacterium]MCH9724541.1 SulP family inorganic anion transporter [Planctomycetota bacterium]MCH9779395.1 SulP family inorganic anion transporter [Planctomycetota bacterium]MCH9791823.1 SulP family inorganic anion transporter [Planctomycetota bacterium]MDF1745239.1 SulP family inorganic anion transporter [Gimesia sp.]
MSQIDPSQNKFNLKNYLNDFNPWHNIKIMHTNIPNDILAGITVAVIAMPLALAFGVASGLGAEAGMWAAICGGIFVGLFGGSNTGVSGPTGPKVVQLAAIIAATKLATGEPDIVFAMSMVFLSGLVCIALALLKIGRFIYYTPYSVVSGFMCGIGVIIILLEIPPMLGFATPNSVIDAIKQIPYDVMHEKPHALIISLTTFITILVWPRITKKQWLPAPLLGLIVGTSIAHIFHFNDIEYIAQMPVGMPHLYIPDFTRFGEMIGGAFALAGLCIFDSLLTCLVSDNMTGERHNSDREIFGQGIANLACGVVGGVTTATATMRTVANVKCGGKTGLASIVHGLVLLALMLGLAPYASYIPMACLAGILLKVGIDIIDYRVMPVLHRMPLTDSVCFWTVLILTISVDLLVAMGVGITIAFVRIVQELGQAYEQEVVSLNQIDRALPADVSMPEELKEKVLKLRLEGPLFFGVSDTVYRASSALVNYKYLIIRMARVPMVDMSGAYLLDDIVEKAHQQGAIVFFTGLKPNVERTLDRLRIFEKMADGNCLKTFNDAIFRIQQLEQESSDKVHVDDEKLSQV